jgi:hypothetical protein
MMKIGCVALLTAASISAAYGQTVVDQSGRDIPPEILGKAIRAVAEQFNDPIATQFRRIHLDDESGSSICGQVNAKNLAGGYVGFAVFEYGIASGATLVRSNDVRDLRFSVMAGCGRAAGLPPAEIAAIKAEAAIDTLPRP